MSNLKARSATLSCVAISGGRSFLTIGTGWHIWSELNSAAGARGTHMMDLEYTLVIEATDDPIFFGFYSPDLGGFTGVGHSIEDCLYKAKWGIEMHIELLKELGLTIPEENPNPKVTIQNEERLAKAF